METALWFAVFGTLLITMTTISASLKRLSLTAAIIYLLVGALLGQLGSVSKLINPLENASWFRLLTEIALIVSLFAAGLKLRLPLKSSQWKVPAMLATSSMMITVVILSAVAFVTFKLPLGASILLAAILSPTDPVLASSVQVFGPSDRDNLRFSLTAEAGLNDGTAFPFILLGLGLLGVRDLGDWGLKWIFIDVLWGIVGGLAVGTLLATAVGILIGYLRRVHQETESFDDFLAIGLISLTYGVATLLGTYGFLAVFSAGLALRRRERQEADFHHLMVDSLAKIKSNTVSERMARSVLQFNEQMERMCELVVVVLLGMVLSVNDFTWRATLIALSLIFIARPISVFLGVQVQTKSHKPLISWFGVRGIGSLYYLAFAIEQGIARELAVTLTEVTFTVVTLSIVIHGLSSARLMIGHERRNLSAV